MPAGTRAGRFRDGEEGDAFQGLRAGVVLAQYPVATMLSDSKMACGLSYAAYSPLIMLRSGCAAEWVNNLD